MRNYKEIKLKVVGHTSDEGTVDYNQKLSENRAKAVANYILSKGIEENRISYEGKGSSAPKDVSNREINRRTEFIIE